MEPAEVKELKPEKGARTEEDIIEEYGLADYDNEQVSKPSPVFQAGLRIRIPIGSGFNRVSGSGFGIRIRIPEGKNDPQK
jgi:hypothetical protein